MRNDKSGNYYMWKFIYTFGNTKIVIYKENSCTLVVAINVNKSTQHKLTSRTKTLSQWIEETKTCAIRESMVQVFYFFLTYAKSPLWYFTLN